MLAPRPQRIEQGAHALPQLGQLILHTRRHLLVDGAGQNSASLKLAQVLGEYLLRNIAERALKLFIAQGSVEQIAHNQGTPAR